MKRNLHQSLWEKIKEVHVTTLIALLTTAISILAVCNLNAGDQYSFKLTNLGSGEFVLWASEKKPGQSITGALFKGITEDGRITGTFTGRLGAVIAYTDDHPPTLKFRKKWPKGIDTVMSLDNIHRIGLTVWVVNVGDSNFETIKRRALNANVRTSQIWHNERQGIEFNHFNIIDATQIRDSHNQIVSDKFKSPNVFADCKAEELIKGIGFTKHEVNVYYVDLVEVTDNRGRDLVGDSYGEYCGNEHLVALGANSSEDLLVHELGHAFNLEHIDHLPQHFDQTNVMHPASSTRNYLTEGQTFRAVANRGSAINNLYHTGANSNPKTACYFDSGVICPPLELQIWRDGDENGESAAQPKNKLPPHMEAFRGYLDLDHEDVLEKAGKKKAPPQTFKQVLRFKQRLEPEFIRLLDKGPDEQVLQARERFLEEQWTRREAFLKQNPNLGLKKDDLEILRSITKQEYVNQGREQLIQRHQEKAIGALGAINTPNGNGALRDFRAKTKSRVLKEIIDRKLPPQKPPVVKDMIAPEKPAGLKVN